MGNDVSKAFEGDLHHSLDEAAVIMYREIVGNKLSNGGYLGVQSGRLRRSLRFAVDEVNQTILFGSNVSYFASYETGNWKKYPESLAPTSHVRHASYAASQWHGKEHRPFVEDTVTAYFKRGNFEVTK